MRLIDAEPLKEKAFYHEIDNVRYVEEEDIDNTPTVDAVEVVRCQDCEHWKPIGKHFGECHNGCHDAEFYCKNGERREE